MLLRKAGKSWESLPHCAEMGRVGTAAKTWSPCVLIAHIPFRSEAVSLRGKMANLVTLVTPVRNPHVFKKGRGRSLFPSGGDQTIKDLLPLGVEQGS